MVRDTANITVQRHLLDRYAKVGEVGLRGKLRDTCNALVVGVYETSIAAFGVERAHATDTKTLETDDARDTLAGLEDEAW
jgi:hypothetical protein